MKILLLLISTSSIFSVVYTACGTRTTESKLALSIEVGPESGDDYLQRCKGCHSIQFNNYQQSLHKKQNMACNLCHNLNEHPDFAEPVGDHTCGTCHSKHYKQLQLSKHFLNSKEIKLAPNPDEIDDDKIRAAMRLARKDLRFYGQEPMPYTTFESSPSESVPSFKFVKNRLCIGCHFDNHRFTRNVVKGSSFCLNCHTDRDRIRHMLFGNEPPNENRCLKCHVGKGRDSSMHFHFFSTPKRNRELEESLNQ